MTIGEKIRRYRKEAGLTQTELGQKLGVKTNAVSKWECGRVEDIPTSKIKAMAVLFDVPISELIDDTILRKAATEKVNSDSFLEKTVNEQRFLLSISDKEAQIITSYRIASPDDRTLVDLVLRKYCENPAQGGQSVG